MSVILALLLHALAPTSAEVEAFRQTDPQDLTYDKASEHLLAARIAGAFHHVDPSLLLAVAWHESRYQDRVITKEPWHRVSCGPMTPIPHRAPCSNDELSTTGGYLAGAEHLKMWLGICKGSEWCALTAYAGGRGLVLICAHGGHSINVNHRDACKAAGEFLWRTKVIRRAMSRAV